jgi:hypothetical protein
MVERRAGESLEDHVAALSTTTFVNLTLLTCLANAKNSNTCVLHEEVIPRLGNVEKRLDGVEKKLDGVEKRLDGVEKRLDGVEKRLDGMQKEMREEMKEMNRKIDGLYVGQRMMSLGLGKSFERYNAAWLCHHLAEKYPELELLTSKTLPTSSMGGKGGPVVEIDIYSSDPLILCEATSVLKDVGKVERFFKKVDLLTSTIFEGYEPPLLYFFVSSIHGDCREEAERLLAARGCTLIVQDPDQDTYSNKF